jgi:hypothetical protein
MKNNVTITYKDGTTETVKPKYFVIEGNSVQFELLEKIPKDTKPHHVNGKNGKFIPFREIREIAIK